MFEILHVYKKKKKKSHIKYHLDFRTKSILLKKY